MKIGYKPVETSCILHKIKFNNNEDLTILIESVLNVTIEYSIVAIIGNNPISPLVFTISPIVVTDNKRIEIDNLVIFLWVINKFRMIHIISVATAAKLPAKTLPKTLKPQSATCNISILFFDLEKVEIRRNIAPKKLKICVSISNP